MTTGSTLITRENLRRAAWDGLCRLARFLGVAAMSKDTWATRRVLADRVLAKVNESRAEQRRQMAADAFAERVSQ